MITWTGHLQENHEIELNTNLSVPQRIYQIFQKIHTLLIFYRKKAISASNVPQIQCYQKFYGRNPHLWGKVGIFTKNGDFYSIKPSKSDPHLTLKNSNVGTNPPTSGSTAQISNSDQNFDLIMFDQCYPPASCLSTNLHTYIFKSNQGDVEKNVCSESMLRNLQICRTAAYLISTHLVHACTQNKIQIDAIKKWKKNVVKLENSNRSRPPTKTRMDSAGIYSFLCYLIFELFYTRMSEYLINFQRNVDGEL